jgi:hypothetical protein
MGLIASQPAEEQIPTAELPRPESRADAEPEPLSEQELEITTADTKPLPPDMAEEHFNAKPEMDEEQMESKVTQTGNTASEMPEKVSGPLLDLGDFEPANSAAEEDFVLDIDLDEGQERAPVARSFGNQTVSGQSLSAKGDRQFGMVDSVDSGVTPSVDPLTETQGEIHRRPASQHAPERAFTEPEIVEGEMRHAPTSAPVAETGQVSLQQLSPEAIDAIARRAVEMLSERVVQEIAWEVVPQLAELLIKRQLEEKNS